MGEPLPRAPAEAALRSHVLQLAGGLSLAELRRLCKSKGLAASGSKAELARRVVLAQQERQQRP